MRILRVAAILVAAGVLACFDRAHRRPPRSRPAPTWAASSGTTGCAAVHTSNSTYTLDITFPNDYPDQQALTAYLTQARDGFVNVSRDAGFVQLAVRARREGNRVPLGLTDRRHAERGVHDVAERRRCAPADVVQLLQLGPR